MMLLLRALTAAAALAAAQATIEDPVCTKERNRPGRWVAEAEEPDKNSPPKANTFAWKMYPDAQTETDAVFANFRGGGYMRLTGSGGQSEDDVTSLDFHVPVTLSGDYHLYVRGAALSGSEDSISVQIMGKDSSPVVVELPALGGDFAASNKWSAANHVWTLDRDVQSVILRLRSREAGAAIDAVVFQLTHMLPPIGSGPPPSGSGNDDFCTLECPGIPGHDCSDHGTCTAMEGTGVCNCVIGYSGTDCSKKMDVDGLLDRAQDYFDDVQKKLVDADSKLRAAEAQEQLWLQQGYLDKAPDEELDDVDPSAKYSESERSSALLSLMFFFAICAFAVHRLCLRRTRFGPKHHLP